jgi:hypothetical protein
LHLLKSWNEVGAEAKEMVDLASDDIVEVAPETLMLGDLAETRQFGRKHMINVFLKIGRIYSPEPIGAPSKIVPYSALEWLESGGALAGWSIILEREIPGHESM